MKSLTKTVSEGFGVTELGGNRHTLARHQASVPCIQSIPAEVDNLKALFGIVAERNFVALEN